MKTLLIALALLAVPTSVSRGDEDADRQRRVRVALVIASPPADSEPVKAAVKLDWFVQGVEVVKATPAEKPKTPGPASNPVYVSPYPVYYPLGSYPVYGVPPYGTCYVLPDGRTFCR